MDLELWIFITAGCLFSCCVGAIATYVAVNWSRDRQAENDDQRRETAIDFSLELAQENQQLEQRKLILHDDGQVLYEPDRYCPVEGHHTTVGRRAYLDWLTFCTCGWEAPSTNQARANELYAEHQAAVADQPKVSD